MEPCTTAQHTDEREETGWATRRQARQRFEKKRTQHDLLSNASSVLFRMIRHVTCYARGLRRMQTATAVFSGVMTVIRIPREGTGLDLASRDQCFLVGCLTVFYFTYDTMCSLFPYFTYQTVIAVF